MKVVPCDAYVAQSLSQGQLFVIPWTIDEAPLSMGYSWQEYWRRLPFQLQRHLLDPGKEPISHVFPALEGGFFSTAPAGYRWVKFCSRPFVSSSLHLIHLKVTISLKLLWKIYVTLSEIVLSHDDPSLVCQCLCRKSSAPMTLGMSLTPGDSIQVESRSQWESVQGEV